MKVFHWIWGFLRSIPLYIRLQVISWRLSKSARQHPSEFVKKAVSGEPLPGEEAREDLFVLCFEHPGTNRILLAHNAGREELEDLYGWLMQAGLAQWIGGYWGVAGCLALAPFLDLLLTELEEGRLEEEPDEIAWCLVQGLEEGWDTMPRRGRVYEQMGFTDSAAP